MTKEIKKDRFDALINALQTRHENDLAEFLIKNESGWFHNEVVTDYFYKGRCIPAISSIIDAIQYFVEDSTMLGIYQNYCRKLQQENTVSGYLCMSIHPLDFLSISENNSQWASNHSLTGEYKNVDLAYLTDTNTILIYIKADEELVKIPHFPLDVPWNNKVWCMPLFVADNNDMLIAGTQYPFKINNILSIVSSSLLNDVFGLYTPWLTKTFYDFS